MTVHSDPAQWRHCAAISRPSLPAILRRLRLPKSCCPIRALHAILLHRAAHWLCRRRVPIIPRLLSHLNRFLTGIEIHPAAAIGAGFFVDHGMGVVIGETTEVGDDVMLYQGVTLGGTGFERGKRHPTLGNGVTVGVGAKILGAVNVGDGAIIGAGAVVLRDVPAHSTVVGIPARVVSVRDPARGSSERVIDGTAATASGLDRSRRPAAYFRAGDHSPSRQQGAGVGDAPRAARKDRSTTPSR